MDLFLVFKNVLRICSALALCILVLTGCKTQGNDTQDAVELEESPQIVATPTLIGFVDEQVSTENIFEFVTLGQYKGIEYDMVSADVSDEDIEEWIGLHLSQAAEVVEVTDRGAIPGDTIVIDYEGFIDGAPFSGGSAEGVKLTIGSNQLLPSFDEQVVGHRTGEQFDINITFPDDYQNEAFAGRPVVYKVNLTNILTKVLPELSDEFIKETLDVPTVAEYRSIVRSQLEKDKALEAENAMKGQVWMTIVGNAVIHKYPQDEVDFREERAMMEFYYYASTYNIEISEFISQVSSKTLEDFKESEIIPGALNDVKQDLVLRAIAAKEGISVADAEFDDAVKKFIDEYRYENEEAFLTLNGENATRIAILSDKVIDFVMSLAVKR